MPLQATSGAASYDGFGGGVAAVPNYIEDVFSTYLYTGNGSTQTITNGIDLSTKGGMTWLKCRSAVGNNFVFDTTRGAGNYLRTNLTNAEFADTSTLSAFNSNGFSLGSNAIVNTNAATYASWTFREQPKFFDVVTYTGTGTQQAISHNLGSTPGCIIVKQTAGASAGIRSWYVYHRSLGATQTIFLNLTNAAQTDSPWGNTSPTSTQFTVNADNNVSGGTYVAYLFAHDAGGFGLTGTDNVISCGSFTTDVSGNANVTLGYEPQWVLIKRTDSTGNWLLSDVMRGTSENSYVYLVPNTTAAETQGTGFTITTPTATGFKCTGGPLPGSATYIYIAIRRGPMKVPTSGTSVFEPVTSTSANFIKGTLEASDMGWFKDRATVANWFVGDRLRGIMSYYNPTLYTNLTNAEATPTTGDTVTSTSSEGTGNGKIYFGGAGATTDQPLGYSFKRAPSFFDEVCYTGTGSNLDVAHNLGVAPELIITKTRGTAGTNWWTFSGFTGSGFNRTALNLTDAASAFNYAVAAGFYSQPTATTLPLSSGIATNTNSRTYVQYLFATCPGVSKVGSYTGNGTTQTINCGFTSGARFILIRKTNDTQSWYVFDSARGIVSGNDPVLLLNTTDSEFTTYDSVDPNSTGFVVNSDLIGLNDSGGNYIFLAIA